MKAGVKFINTTVNGIGERAGNASMVEVVEDAKYLFNLDAGVNSRVFPEMCEFVAKASNRMLPASYLGDIISSRVGGLHYAFN